MVNGQRFLMLRLPKVDLLVIVSVYFQKPMRCALIVFIDYFPEKKLKILQNLQENICAQAYFLIKLHAATLLKMTLIRVFSCQFCDIFKNTDFGKTSLKGASVLKKYDLKTCDLMYCIVYLISGN